MIKILFLCLGNICRSPLAEAIMDSEVKQRGFHDLIRCDSAGTGHWHVGEPPDYRALDVLKCYGHETGHRGRLISPNDFNEFHYIVAMDANNLRDARAMAPLDNKAEILMMRQFDPHGNGNVPDPYWGEQQEFEEVYHLLKRCCQGFLDFIIQKHELEI